MNTSFTAQELCALPAPSPSNWIVEGILRSERGRPSLLCGFPESGKSTLSNQLAVAVANGTPFLGRETKQGHVILWKTEDSAADISADLQRAGLTSSSDLSILLPDGGTVDYMVRLKSELEKYPDSRLVIVETLADFFNVEDITSNDEGRKHLQAFCDLIVTCNPHCAFLILHQFNKSNADADLSIKKILGGTALAAGTDAKIYLRQVSDQDRRRVIHATVRKGSPIEPTYLNFDEHTLTATLGDTITNEAIQKRKIDKAQKDLDLDGKILQIIGENPGLAKWVIVRLVGGRAAITSARIDALIEINLIDSKPTEGKGNPQLLSLPIRMRLGSKTS